MTIRRPFSSRTAMSIQPLFTLTLWRSLCTSSSHHAAHPYNATILSICRFHRGIPIDLPHIPPRDRHVKNSRSVTHTDRDVPRGTFLLLGWSPVLLPLPQGESNGLGDLFRFKSQSIRLHNELADNVLQRGGLRAARFGDVGAAPLLS